MKIALDLETDPIVDGVDPHPRPACCSHALADEAPDLVRWEHIPDLVRAVAESDAIAVTHNGPMFDFPVLVKHCPELLPYIYKILDEGRVVDTMIREALGHIRDGTLQEESQRNAGLLKLETCARRHLGVQLDKGADSWRLRFGELRD